jgi:phage terminase small subunit
MAKMTAKQRRFCDEYLIDLNATQAAIRPGYSSKTAYSIGEENLKKPELKKYIDSRMAEKEDELIAKQDEVLKFLTAVMRGEAKDEKPMVNAVGEIEMLPVRQQSNQLKAAEMLAKRYGLLIDKTESDVDMNLEIKIDYGAE